MKIFAKLVFFQSIILIFVFYSLYGLYMHGFSFNYLVTRLVDREFHAGRRKNRSVKEQKKEPAK